MKTLIIFSDFDSLPVFFLVDGDYRKLDGLLLNTLECEESGYFEELSDLIFTNSGTYKHPIFLKLPKPDKYDFVINIGMVP